MARGADQRGIRRGQSHGSSARRERRSELPPDFDDLLVEEDNSTAGGLPLAANVIMPLDEAEEVQEAFGFAAGHESPASSLLIFGDDHSAFSSVSSVSPTSVAQVVGFDGTLGYSGEADANEISKPASAPPAAHKKKRALIVSTSSLSAPPPALESIDLLKLIESSSWHELRRAIAVLTMPSSDQELVARALSTTNCRGETPFHTLAWKAPTALVLQALNIRGVSSCLTTRDRDMNTPLHLACANVTHRSEFAVIRNMANLAPQALTLQNEHGDTPLHLLVSSQAFLRSNDYLLEAESASVMSHLFSLPSSPREVALIPNRDEATMLHICLAVGAHERVILKVLNAAPDAATRKDHFGYLPLHYVAAFGGTPWPVVAKLIEAFPESVRATTSDGDTPLHLLMSNGAKFLREQKRDSDGAAFLDRNTTKLAELLMDDVGTHYEHLGGEEQGTPDPLPPLLMVNKSELNPLHVSACFDSPPQLIKILIESRNGPKAVMAATSLGYTPLHLACAGIRKHKVGKSKSSKRLLASVVALATPDACAARDSLGRTPLMLAVQNKKADKHVIRALLRVLPSAIEHRTANGYLPLHLAVQSKHANESVVKTLITEYPKSIYEKSLKGETVLHVACLVSKIPYGVVDLLVRKYPGAVDCENAGHELPIDRARAMGASKKVCALLLETAKKNVRGKDVVMTKNTRKSSAASRASGASSASNGNAKSVGFFAPQVREPSSLSNAAPDPPTDISTVNSRSADPTPVRRRGQTPEPSKSLLGPPEQHPVAATTPRVLSDKQRSVVFVESSKSATRESRSRDRTSFTARRAMSVSQEVHSGSSDLKRRARTRSPARAQGDVCVARKPILDRRAKSEASLQPPIARKRVTRLAKGESTSAISRGNVYRFEI